MQQLRLPAAGIVTQMLRAAAGLPQQLVQQRAWPRPVSNEQPQQHEDRPHRASLHHQAARGSSAVADAGVPLSGLLMSSRRPFKAVLVDAAGTLLMPSERTAGVYLRFASRYGCVLSEQQVLERFRSAYNTPWGGSPLRYVGDGRPFWRSIVRASTGCSAEGLFDELYDYYAQPEAWALTTGAVPALSRLKAAGVRLAVVSNFDTRLRPLLASLRVDCLFDTVVVSAEVGAEKPSPRIYEAALDALQAAPWEAVHVGDDRRNDVWGARDAGLNAWLWGVDVHSFDEVARRVLKGPSGLMESDSDSDEESG